MEHFYYHARYDSDGNATHRGQATHSVVESPKLVQWNLSEFQDDISSCLTDWKTRVGEVHGVPQHAG